MTSTVTDNFARETLSLLKNDIDAGIDTYYIGLARATPYREKEDNKSLEFQRDVRETLLAVKTISSTSFVVPRVNWVQNTRYNAYDTNLNVNENYYVLNSAKEVFICIEPEISVTGVLGFSTVEPTSLLAKGLSQTFQTSDGYRWRFLYSISNVDQANFLINSLMPVKKITSTEQFLAVAEDFQQRTLQDSAVRGEIIGISIDSAGTGYSVGDDAPTLSIIGNGSNASFSLEVDDGKISKVSIDSDGIFESGKFLHGQNYDYAEAVVSYGDAVLRPIISDQYGLGQDPQKALKATSLMIQTSFQGDEFDTILDKNDFNQIVIIKNLKPYTRIADSDYTGNTGLGVHTFNVTPGSQIFDQDQKFLTSTNATARTVHHDEILGKLYFYQDKETGYNSYIGSGSATQLGSAKSVTINSLTNPDIDIYSGEIIYINNIGTSGVDTDTIGILREDAQTENIRVILQLG